MRLAKLAVIVLVFALLAPPLQAKNTLQSNNGGTLSVGMGYPCIEPNGETKASLGSAHRHIRVDPLKAKLTPGEYELVFLALNALRSSNPRPTTQSDFNAIANHQGAGASAALAKVGIDVTNFLGAELMPPVLRNSNGSLKTWSAINNSTAGQTVYQKENVTTTEQQTVTVYMCRCAGCSHWSGTPIRKTYAEFLRDWASGAISLTWGNPVTDGYRCCTPVAAGTEQRTVSVTKLEDVPVAKVYSTVSFPQTLDSFHDVHTTKSQWRTSVPTQVYMCRCAGCSHWSGTPIHKTYAEFLRDWASGAISLSWGNPVTDGYRCCTPVAAGIENRSCPGPNDSNWTDCWTETTVDQWVWHADVPSNQQDPKTGKIAGSNQFINTDKVNIPSGGVVSIPTDQSGNFVSGLVQGGSVFKCTDDHGGDYTNSQDHYDNGQGNNGGGKKK